jgi:predicted ABC-type ATPase
MIGMQKSRLIIVAGPNGSGKTTITEQGLAHEWFEGCVYINPDLIAQRDFNGWNDVDSVLSAAKKATQLRYDTLAKGESLAFETVFSSQEKLDFIRLAKAQGYFIRFFFICTDSPLINAARITQRVIEGGHEVPISKIVSRYSKSIVYAYQAMRLVDRFYLYDNSVDDTEPKLLARLSHGQLQKLYVDDLPSWAKDFIG